MLLVALLALGCGDKDDTGAGGDGGATDGGATDGGTSDGGTSDGGADGGADGGTTSDGGADGGNPYEIPLSWDPTGAVWLIGLGEADWVQPTTVGGQVAAQLSLPLMLQVVQADTTMDLRLGWAVDSGAHQDLCQVTTDTLATWLGEAPVLSTERFDLAAPTAGEVPAPFSRTFLTATFGAEGEPLVDVVLEGQWDMRQWAATGGVPPLTGADADALCASLASAGVACEACDTDGAVYCTDVEAELKVAPYSALEMAEVTAAMVEEDPRCD